MGTNDGTECLSGTEGVRQTVSCQTWFLLTTFFYFLMNNMEMIGFPHWSYNYITIPWASK